MKCINLSIPQFKQAAEEIGELKLSKILEEHFPEDIPTYTDIKNKYNQESQINYSLKAIDILSSDKAKQVFAKGEKNNWDLDKILTELQVPKEQKQIILDKGISNREEIITSLLADNSFVVEVNTAKEKGKDSFDSFVIDGNRFTASKSVNLQGETKITYWKNNSKITKEEYDAQRKNTQYYSNLTVPGGTNYTENEIATPAIIPTIKGHAQFSTDNGIGWFRSDEQVKIGSYEDWLKENKDFYKDIKDEKTLIMLYANEVSSIEGNQSKSILSTKTRRILEVQSDLFQKGRGKDNLINYEKGDYKSYEKDGYSYFTIGGEFFKQKEVSDDNKFLPGKEEKITKEEFEKNIDYESNQNSFLQLLNKDNNWVTFFIKSIIQDSAKKGYEKVLFPLGDTAAKIEGHTTLEEFKKQKEDRIKELEEKYVLLNEKSELITEYINKELADKDIKEDTYKQNPEYELLKYSELPGGQTEITQLKQEIADVESGQTQLSSIANFYENTVTNILKKQGYNPVEITDEYGNTWNEVTIDSKKQLRPIELQREFTNLPSYSDIMAHVMPKEMKAIYDKASRSSLINLLDKLSSKFNIPYQLDDTIKVIGMTRSDGVIVINPKLATHETAFHEFAHPLVAMMEQENPIGYRALLREVKATFPGLEEAVKQLYPDYDKKQLNRELITTAIGLNAAQEGSGKKNSWFDKFWNWISEILSNLFGATIQVDKNTTLQKMVATLVNETSSLDLSSYIDEEFQRDFTSYTEKQQKVLNEIQNIKNANARLVGDNKYQVEEYPNILMDRVTATINNNPYYTYEGEEQPLSIDWGNSVDTIAAMALTNQGLTNAIDTVKNSNREGTITDEAITQIYNQVSKYRDSQQGSIFVPQIIFFNLGKERAGTGDIIQILPDGQTILIDVKSSKYTTEGDYEVTSKTGNIYTRNYDKPFKSGKSSIKQKHEAQLSSYKGLAHSKGLRIDHLAVLPIHLSDIIDNQVLEASMEKIRTTEGANIIGVETIEDLIENYTYTIENANDSIYEGNQIDENIDTRAKKLHETVLLKLKEEITKLSNEKGPYSKARANKLEKLQNAIKDARSLIALESFVNELVELFVEATLPNGDKIKPNFKREYEQVIKDLKFGQYKDNFEAIAALQGILDHIRMYEGTIKEIQQFYYDNPSEENKEAEAGSNMDKIKKVLDSFGEAKFLASKAKMLIAEILGKVENTKSTEAITPYVNRFEKAMNRELLAEDQRYEKLKSTLNSDFEIAKAEEKHLQKRAKIKNKFEGKIQGLQQDIGSADNILGLFQNGYTDIPTQDAWLSPLSSSSNPIASNFVKIIKRNLTGVRSDLQAWGVKANNYLNAVDKKIGILKTSATINEELISEANGKLYLASEIDYAKFNEARQAERERNEINYLSTKAKDAANRMWYQENTVQVGLLDKTIKDPITGETIIVEKGINTIIKEKKKELSLEYNGQGERYQEAYENWLNYNSTMEGDTRVYTGYAFRKPNPELYKNTKFENIQNNKDLKQYYDFLLATLAQAHLIYPKGRDSKNIYQLPSIHKGTIDRLRENGIKNLLQFNIKTTFSEVTEEDAEIYGANVYSPGTKTIPVMYQSDMPTSEISRDLVGSIARYYQTARRYEVSKTMQPFAEATLQAVKDADKLETNVYGVAKTLKAAEELGLKFKNKVIDPNQSQLGQALEAFIDAEIYGIKEKKLKVTAFNKELDVNKLANLWSSVFSLTTIAGKPLTAAANYLQQNVMLAMEGVAGEYINKSSYAFAQKEYYMHEGDFIKDMVEGTRKSLIGQLTDLYDPQMDRLTDQFGHNLSQGAFKRFMNTSTLYHGMKAADHQIYVTSMIAVLKDTKVKTSKGSEISLYEAYELGEDGVIKLKEGIELGNEGKIQFTSKEKMDAMNQRLHGVYNTSDRPMAERYMVGRQLTMFRKFVVPGIKKRYKKLSIDHNLGTTTEGYYVTFFRLMKTEFNELKNWAMFNENNLEPMEKANLRRFLFEAGAMLLLSVIIAGLSSMYEDDDDKTLLGYPMYLAYRLRSEMKFYYDPKDSMRILRSPTVTYTMLERITKFVGQLTDPTAEYQKDYGMWEKGDNKLWAKWLKMFGMTGYTTNPDVAYEQLKRFTEN